MRPIDQRELPRDADLLTLEASNAAILKIGHDEERKAFMKAHESECSALRTALWRLGQKKCWYSEAILQESAGHVEHYRPKKRLSGAGHSGYWWRAFDWRNLRLAHPTVNRRKTDHLTRKRAGKGSYFPLREEGARANNQAEEANEEPILLDPVVPADTRLICFSEESGTPRPRHSAEENEWAHRRAEASIDYYHLNEGTWNVRRAELMAAVRKLCDQLDGLLVQDPRDEGAYNQKLDEIYAYINPHAEFSAACLQVVAERNQLSHLF